MRRIITIQVEIADQKEAAWIWDNHMNSDGSHGVHVTAIHEGEITKPNDYEEEYSYGPLRRDGNYQCNCKYNSRF